MSTGITTFVRQHDRIDYQHPENHRAETGRVWRIDRQRGVPWLQVIGADGNRAVVGLHEIRKVHARARRMPVVHANVNESVHVTH